MVGIVIALGCRESSTTSTSSWEHPAGHAPVEPSPGSADGILTAPISALPSTGDVTDSGTIEHLDELELARGDRLTEVQRRIAEMSGGRGAIGQGVGGVMTFGRIPWKVVVIGENITLYDGSGNPLRLARPSVPYFVFEQRGENLLIGRSQDEELVHRNGGWLNARDCFSWYSRRLVYPLPDSLAAQALIDGLGPEYALPEYDVERTMPWPILAETGEADWLILCDLRYYGSGFWPLPIKAEHIDEFQLFVIFSETELDHTIKNITALGAIVDSGRVAVSEIPKVLGSFVTQNQVDFLDLAEARRAIELFPGGSPDFLMERELNGRVKSVMQDLLGQLRWLLRVVRSRGYYNEAHGIYVVPLEELNRIKLEAA